MYYLDSDRSLLYNISNLRINIKTPTFEGKIMPYIPEEDRGKYNKLINRLAWSLNDLPNNDKLSGELNYVLFRLARLLCDEKSGGKHGYARMAVVLSALSEAQVEFRRRVMVPYEDGKIKEAGDVEL